MSTYVLMRLLESAPRRYDIGMRLLSLGRLGGIYDRLTSHIECGQRVLDIGCGTGALTLRAARRGARVKGIDTDAQMMEVAAEAVQGTELAKSVELVEMGVAELDREPSQHYDAVMSGLCLSELSEEETTYALKEVARILRPGGLLLVADEIRPRSLLKRSIHRLLRVPLATITYVICQRTTHPAANLPEKFRGAGFSIVSVRLNLLGSFGEFVARKPGDTSA